MEENRNDIQKIMEVKTNAEISLSYNPDDFDANIARLNALTAKSQNAAADSGEEFNLATRMLLEDYDGDDLAKLIKPLFGKKGYDGLCFLFFSIKSARNDFIDVRAARGQGVDKFRARFREWLNGQDRYIPFNFFRTGEFNFNAVKSVKDVIDAWRTTKKDDRGQTIETVAFGNERLADGVDGKAEEKKEFFYVVGPKYDGKNGSTTPVTADVDTAFTYFKTSEKWSPKENQGPQRDVTIHDVQRVMNERVVPYSDFVLSQCGFHDAAGKPCVRDYFLPFFFTNREGKEQYYGRVRFGISEQFDLVTLQDLFTKIYKLASSLFGIESSLRNAVSAKSYKRFYVESRQARRNLLSLLSSRDPERFDNEKVRNTYGQYLHCVLNNDPRMIKYKPNLCILQTTIPGSQFPGQLQNDKWNRISFDSELVYKETGKSLGNVENFDRFVKEEIKRKNDDVGFVRLAYNIGPNPVFQTGLLQWGGLLGSFQSSPFSNSNSYFLKTLDLNSLPLGKNDRFCESCARIRNSLKDSSPVLSVCVVPRPKRDEETIGDEKSASYFWASCYNLFGADGSQDEIKNEDLDENDVLFPTDPKFDPSATPAHDGNRPFELPLWADFMAMRQAEFTDMHERKGCVLIGMPVTFENGDLSEELLCYRAFAVLSRNDEAMDEKGNLINPRYYDDLYDVFYDLVDELRLIKKCSAVAEQRGREKARRQNEPIEVARKISDELFKRYAGLEYSDLRDQRVQLSLTVRKIFQYLDSKKGSKSDADDREKSDLLRLKFEIRNSAFYQEYIGSLVAREIAPAGSESANETRPDLRAERFQTLFEKTVADCAKADNFSPAECMCNRVVYSIRENDVRKIQGKDVKGDANRAKFWAVLFVCLKVAILKLARERNLRDPDAETSERYKRMQREMNEEFRRKLKSTTPEDVLTEADVDIEEVYKALFPFPSKTLCLPWDSQDKYRQSCESAFKVNRIFDSIEELKEKSSRKKKGADKTDNKIKISDVRSGNLKFLKKITNGEEILRSFLKEAADDILDNYMKEIQARVW